MKKKTNNTNELLKTKLLRFDPETSRLTRQRSTT